MNKRKILDKLKSRKWWLGLSGAVGGFLTIVLNASTAAKIAGAILAAGSVVGYILGEGLVDAAHKKDVDKDDKGE